VCVYAIDLKTMCESTSSVFLNLPIQIQPLNPRLLDAGALIMRKKQLNRLCMHRNGRAIVQLVSLKKKLKMNYV